MNERLLTETEISAIDAAPDLWPASVAEICKAQDKKSCQATLRECGEWLDGVLYSSQYAGIRIATLELSVEALKRGEAPWEVMP